MSAGYAPLRERLTGACSAGATEADPEPTVTVRDGGVAAVTAIVIVLLAVWPLESLALNETLLVPAAVGVPRSVAVAGVNVSPAGRVPLVRVKE
jgi:hypothetical protein